MLTYLAEEIHIGSWIRYMETPTPSLRITVPLETEVLREHRGMVVGTSYSEEHGVVAQMDVRRLSWQKILKLSAGTKVHWADVRTVEIRELSALPWSITYQLTYGDGWYLKPDGRRQYFPLQKYIVGIDLERQCTVVAIRAAVLLAVVAGVGLRCVCWLMNLLFHFQVTKSSLDRWVKECAARLPDAAGMAQVLHADKPITEAHFDEIFAKGQRPKQCTLVLRDEHGRIFAVKQVEERTTETVCAFLREVKGWGLTLRVFYVDGCEAYRLAIANVFPTAVIQYDYFHVVQNIWRKLWKSVVALRKDIKARGESLVEKARKESAAQKASAAAPAGQAPVESPVEKASAEVPAGQTPAESAVEKASAAAPAGQAPVESPVQTPESSVRLLSLAKRIWENRYVFFKRDENLKPAEREALPALLEEEPLLAQVRGFVQGVWGLFNQSQSEQDAKNRLAELKVRPEVRPGSAFAKSVVFLESRFPDMIAFLRHPTFVKRNSLAETGIRCLRRLEQGHDGFRGAAGLDRYLRLYQAIKYCRWTVYGLPREVPLLPTDTVDAVHSPDSPGLCQAG
jgi:hypothetical protein